MFVLEPDTAIHAAGIVLGVVLCAAGLGAGAIALRPADANLRSTSPRDGRSSWTPAVVGGLAVMIAAVAVLIGGDGPEAPAVAAAAPTRCNGSAALCDRRLDQVVLAGTHNSYAAADQPGWYFPNQRRTITRQLDDGIRALLLDVHLGVADAQTGRARTDLEAEGGTRTRSPRRSAPKRWHSPTALPGASARVSLRVRARRTSPTPLVSWAPSLLRMSSGESATSWPASPVRSS